MPFAAAAKLPVCCSHKFDYGLRNDYATEQPGLSASAGGARAQICIDVVLRVDDRALSSAAVIGIVVGCVLLLLLVIDILCCLIGNLGLLAMMCRRTKRSPSDLGDEEKLGR
ncbi:hypothetical protein RP20_CCG028551 [Aedes albopictus]|nr:hypothetical protein RP20_CCG028551 [Aedes albopictus]